IPAVSQACLSTSELRRCSVLRFGMLCRSSMLFRFEFHHRKAAAILFTFTIALLLLSCQPHHRSVTIATTTSVEGSGLLQVMRVEFERQTGIMLNAFVVGSGSALRLASEGKVDLTITHDPEAERVFIARNKPDLYRQ